MHSKSFQNFVDTVIPPVQSLHGESLLFHPIQLLLAKTMEGHAYLVCQNNGDSIDYMIITISSLVI